MKNIFQRLFIICALMLAMSSVSHAYVYGYSIEGSYHLDGPVGPTLHFYGAAVIEDSYDENQTLNYYDEWYINSWEIEIEGYAFEGDGIIQRWETSVSLQMNGLVDHPWGDEEKLSLTITGPYYEPPETFALQMSPFDFFLPNDSIALVHDIKFYDQFVIDVPEPSAIFLMGLGLCFLYRLSKNL